MGAEIGTVPLSIVVFNRGIGSFSGAKGTALESVDARELSAGVGFGLAD